jgi:signal transduction histidine kinase
VSFAVAPVATPPRARVFTAVVIAAAVGAAAAGTVALAHGAARDQTTTLAAVTLLAALSFVGSGLVAWRRRPQVWTGALMVAAGFCLFAGSLANFDSAVPFTIGLVVSPVAAAVIGHLVLSFPEGRLHSPLECVVVAGAYVVTIPLQVVMLMFMGFEHVTGCPCPSNLLFVRDEMAVHSTIMTTQRLLGIALAVAAGAIVVRRWQHASAPLRRALAPILLTGGVTILLLLGTLLAAQASTRARIVEAGDTERRRLERNLHDGAQQRLVSLALALGLAESKVEQEPTAAVALLQSAREELTEALGELRELARGIHPAVLTERGLPYALQALAERAPVEVELDLQLDRRPPAALEAAAYYVVAEALANVAKYAKATTARVRVKMDDQRLVVEVADDGVGGADPSGGSELRGLDDRVQAFGGSLRVRSRPGEGTRVLAELPVQP